MERDKETSGLGTSKDFRSGKTEKRSLTGSKRKEASNKSQDQGPNPTESKDSRSKNLGQGQSKNSETVNEVIVTGSPAIIRVSHPCLLFNRKHGTRHNPIRISTDTGDYYCSDIKQLTGTASIKYVESGVVQLHMEGTIKLRNFTTIPPHLEDRGIVFELFPGG